MKKQNKKAMQLSFSFIFSLIIIAIVIFVAIWAIKQFLEIKDRTQLQMIRKDIEEVVIEVWQAEEVSRVETFYVPKSLEYLCFYNYSNRWQGVVEQRKELEKFGQTALRQNNLFYLPFELKIRYDIQGAYKIKCGNVECLEIDKNICFENKGGKIRIRFVKKSGEKVKIRQP